MRRVRLSTVILTIIFLAALVAYLLVKPTSAAGRGRPHPVSPTASSGSVAPLPGVPLPGPTTPPRSG